MSQLFLPERHPVRDFFVLDALDVAPRSDMASMEHPIFSLSSKPETRPLKYTHGENSIEIIPSVLGLPTVFDKDVLIYCISKLVDMQNSGRNIGPSIRLTTHDLLVQTNRPTNNLGYERVAPALDRLKGVTIKTNIKTGDSITTRGFGLISEFEYNRKGSMFADRLRYLEIELSPWLFRAIEACEVLPISRSYFRLRQAAGSQDLRTGAQALRPAEPVAGLNRGAAEEIGVLFAGEEVRVLHPSFDGQQPSSRLHHDD